MEKIQSKMKELEWSQHYQFLRCSKVANSIMGDGILTEFKNSSKLLWLSFVSARMNMIYSKMKALEWSQPFSHNKSMGIFKAFIVDLVTCKNEEDPIKNESARVVTTLSISF